MGDKVEVPGGMHGTVKFIGPVDGKKGVFAGVQLAPEYAPRGKNSGEVDGKSYFKTSKPGSGIFLPVEKAIRKTTPPTPQTPSFSQGGRAPLAALPKPNFSQSVGPGARASSPTIKNRRPSVPRPQSPVRQTPAKLATPRTRPSAGLAKSQIGTAPTFKPSPGLKVTKFTQSLRAASAITPNKNSFSPLGPESAFDEEPENTPTPTAAPASALAPKSIDQTVQDKELKRLKVNLEEKDRQLKEQATSLADMEKSLTELQHLFAGSDVPLRPSQREREEQQLPDDVVQLRGLLREKNEKIAMLTAEFDAHRADFRSTIDTLEMASTETERVYEQRVDELLQQVRELQDRSDDSESVAEMAVQFKQLEELVQELEEGLENSRRMEAEARGEVEFLRGEVERSRSELRHERERAAASASLTGNATTLVGAGGEQTELLHEMEQRDDEIRGLKAIIQSLSGGKAVNGRTNGYGNGDNNYDHVSALERRVNELEILIERKAYREEELEAELDRLRTSGSHKDRHKSASTVRDHRLSDRTIVQGSGATMADSQQSPIRAGGVKPGTHKRTPSNLETMHETTTDSQSTLTDGSTLWCEICETAGHDILTCTSMFGNGGGDAERVKQQQAASHANGGRGGGNSEIQRTGRDVVVEGLKGLATRQQHQQSHEKQGSVDRPAPLIMKKMFSGPAAAVPPPGPVPGVKLPDPMSIPPEGMVPGRTSGVIDEQKWCALCERDGHESVDCPFEEAF